MLLGDGPVRYRCLGAAGRRRVRSRCLQMLPEHLVCVHCGSVLRLDDLFVHECPANKRGRGIVTRRWRCRQAAAGLPRFQHPDHGQGPWLRRLGIRIQCHLLIFAHAGAARTWLQCLLVQQCSQARSTKGGDTERDARTDSAFWR